MISFIISIFPNALYLLVLILLDSFALARFRLIMRNILFGLMWCVSCFTKTPLTAHYSKNSYNGDAALRNPIFMKTNRILTAAWGILYLLTPIWTFFIMRTDAGSYVGAINSILPALMGIFTTWFQKWYPKHVASGK